MITHSQIVVVQPATPVSRLPAGFDEVDISILDWIAGEGQRVGRSFVRCETQASIYCEHSDLEWVVKRRRRWTLEGDHRAIPSLDHSCGPEKTVAFSILD